MQERSQKEYYLPLHFKEILLGHKYVPVQAAGCSITSAFESDAPRAFCAHRTTACFLGLWAKTRFKLCPTIAAKAVVLSSPTLTILSAVWFLKGRLVLMASESSPHLQRGWG